jgi:hypothetical protein
MSKSNTLDVSQEERDAYSMLAKKSLENKISLTKKAISENPEFAALAATSPSSIDLKSGSLILGAQFAITSAFVHSWISTNTPLHFPDNVDLRFKADVWGIGLGGGVVWLSGWLAPAEELIGDVHFVFSTSVLHTEIAFSKGIHPVGVLAGGGLNVQAGVFGGNGTFARW